ncbi:DNA translocase FtsK [Rickettsiales endosymbiont of Paramecium tredecaurelia]|uniref:FtsK/SpoIIIE family DNA translocase n=1 Tax=Candidatus Sarmatiella mevalonica TaxID=2770581 RepID=UPI001FC8AA0F|nr:DNA translocase FtsK 4TM domain-containing protein [Candidatus Sarmatiella mevalonica]MBL3285136.1 DNA translocase FtsK [Candidatus Sarmatiella mevalonica]
MLKNKILCRAANVLLFIFGIVLFLSIASYSYNDPCFNLALNTTPSNLLGKAGSTLADITIQAFGLICAFFISVAILARQTIILIKKTYAIETAPGSKRINKLCFCLLLPLLSSLNLSRDTLEWLEDYFPNFHGFAILQDQNILGFIFNKTKNLLLYICGVESTDYTILQNISIVEEICILFLLAFYFRLFFPFVWIIRLVILRKSKMAMNNHISSVKTQDKLRRKAIAQKSHSKLPQAATILGAAKTAFKFAKKNAAPGARSIKRSSLAAAGYSLKEMEKFDTNNVILPSIELLHATTLGALYASRDDLYNNQKALLQVLKDFGVNGSIEGVCTGPVVTLYEFKPVAGIKSSRIIGLATDIARTLSALSARIAIIPGKDVLGIELPNKKRATFGMRMLLESAEYQDSDLSIPLILGLDIAGRPYVVDLAKMPHLLVAGTTGSGKSVSINVMILSLLYRFTPNQCRVIMIDPKMLELSVYNDIPHLLEPVITCPHKAVLALQWLVKEMNRRYSIMSDVGVRNLHNYNEKVRHAIANNLSLEKKAYSGFNKETGEQEVITRKLDACQMPFIVVIVDEMAHLMMTAGKEVENNIQKLAQMARASGIHLIMATQRPSTDVITGVIKANFPTRISFKVTSGIDSRIVIGEQGADQLLGKGDMLYLGVDSKVTRLHAPFVSDDEVEKVVDAWKLQASPEYVGIIDEMQEGGNSDVGADDDKGGGGDDNYQRAKEIVLNERKTSISYVQRRMGIGYNKAANLIERMEKEGLLSSPSSSGKREILD